MVNLRHVILWAWKEEGLLELAAALPLMSQLETLYLSFMQHAKLPALDLKPCTYMQRSRLGGIAPAGLALGSSCSLHLALWSMEHVCEPVWATLSVMHALCLTNLNSTAMTFERTPLLSGAAQLDTDYLDFRGKQMTTPGLAQAMQLHINGIDAFIASQQRTSGNC